jgi:hypothetical protein
MKLIAMACSQTKIATPGMMPAIDRYDGPMWRTLRAALEGEGERPQIWFLSARYGFQLASLQIADYDHRVTSWPARITNAEGFARSVNAADAALFAGGALYRQAMRRSAYRLPAMVALLDHVTETDGLGIGYQRAQLKAWIAEHCAA